MIKYKVSEVAKDLNVPSKAVIEAIKECCGVTKKSGNVLTDQELNVVLSISPRKIRSKTLINIMLQEILNLKRQRKLISLQRLRTKSLRATKSKDKRKIISRIILRKSKISHRIKSLHKKHRQRKKSQSLSRSNLVAEL